MAGPIRNLQNTCFPTFFFVCWAACCVSVGPRLVQMAKLSPKGFKLRIAWFLCGVHPRPCRIETGTLDDVGPVRKIITIRTIPCTFWRPALSENAPRAEAAPVEQIVAAPKLSRLGTFGGGGFDFVLPRKTREDQGHLLIGGGFIDFYMIIVHPDLCRPPLNNSYTLLGRVQKSGSLEKIRSRI